MIHGDRSDRIRNVGLSRRRVLLVVTLVVLAGIGAVAVTGTAIGGDGATVDTVAQDDDETELTSFVAESQGGYVAFSADSEAEATDDPTPFPVLDDGEQPIVIEADVDDGTWESTDITFPDLQVDDDLEAEVDVVDGLSGEIDPEAGVMTSEGEFEVTVGGETFSYESSQRTGESGSLEGSADFDSDPAEITLVDNEFVVEDETGNSIVDNVLGLPAEEPGENWLELHLDVSLDQEEAEQRDVDDGADTDDEESTETLVLTIIGQAFGFVGLGAAVLTMLVTVIARTGLISLDSE